MLAKSLEDQLARDLELGEDSGSEDESDTLPLEWEAVSKLLIRFNTYLKQKVLQRIYSACCPLNASISTERLAGNHIVIVIGKLL